MEVQNIYDICRKSASHDTGISFQFRNPGKSPERISYRGFWDCANQDVSRIDNIPGIKRQRIILLHFDLHQDSIRWFWAVVAAGYIPAISPPLTSDIHQRKQHLSHVFNLLGDPVVLTTKALQAEFQCQNLLHLHVCTAEYLQQEGGTSTAPKLPLLPPGSRKKPDELAVLMLTSGSSGNAKAVCLQHGQIIHALKGKIACHQTKLEDRFLNYIGLDHVANLTEVHLHAMYLGAEQTHILGPEIMVHLLWFLHLINEHRISYTFATKNLLASLVRSLKSEVPHELDLSCLKAIITGGDATPIITCTALIEKLRSFGAVENFLHPGFGMTETCAGCTYNKACPEYEQKKNFEYASQGIPTQAISMRVVSTNGEEALGVSNGVKGSLQARGLAVFSEYYNNPQATKESFTSDGWFRTGDDAIIYPDDHLVIVGRAKDTITINGKEFTPLDFETAIEKAEIPGVTPSYTVFFAFRHPTSDAECICIIYVPEPEYGDLQARPQISDAIAEECVKVSGVVPWDILAVDEASLPKSSLGKISRVKTQKAYESGALFKVRGSTSV
ncbi:MAG: hypothetical protein ALECFALPRED_004895 [Alectoria fallacina]|uniref:AMP-dependent synthetase/ligase domain-containing protein n=1 Tax=Alectoria fallacina TaxID=1903189 RepID=A0A8H3EN96_9LECA|nr:MAG: hypothetical protein ALECFALPRED_004895 [Alectoria fallacina]